MSLVDIDPTHMTPAGAVQCITAFILLDTSLSWLMWWVSVCKGRSTDGYGNWLFALHILPFWTHWGTDWTQLWTEWHAISHGKV